MDDGQPNKSMIAANAGLTGDTINIPDAYKAKGFDFSGTKAFDEKTGYRSISSTLILKMLKVKVHRFLPVLMPF